MKSLVLFIVCAIVLTGTLASTTLTSSTNASIAAVSDAEGSRVVGGDPCGGIPGDGFLSCGTGCRVGQMTGVCPDIPTKYVEGSGDSKVVDGPSQTCSVCNANCATLTVNIVTGCSGPLQPVPEPE